MVKNVKSYIEEYNEKNLQAMMKGMNNRMDIQILNFLRVLKSAFHEEVDELSEPDWNKMYACAAHHSVLPIILEGCVKYSEFYSASEEIRNKFMTASLQTVAQQTWRTNAFLKVYDRLLQEGLKPLVLKGVVCRSTYKDLSDYRPSGDEDILIRKDEFERCKTILTDAGYLMEDLHITDKLLSKVFHIRFSNPNTGLRIEVHLSLMMNNNEFLRGINTYFTDVFDRCSCIKINSNLIYTLNPTQHYLFLFFHFLKHFTGSGVGIRQMLDLYMYHNYYKGEIDWNEVEESILKMSAGSLYADVIGIGCGYLGFDIATKFPGYNKELLFNDIMATGLFGNITRVQALSGNITRNALNYGGNHISQTLFPKLSELETSYPILLNKPYLLIFIWIKRLFRYVGRSQNERRLVRGSRIIGKQRVQMLKDYNII